MLVFDIIAIAEESLICPHNLKRHLLSNGGTNCLYMLRNLFYIMFGSSLPEDKRDTGDPFCYKISRCFWDINFPGPSDYCHTLEHPASSLLVLVHMQNLAVEPRKELGLNFCSFFFIYQSDSRDQLENSERPGVVISNHISYLDILYHMSTSFPSFVAKVCHLHYLKNSH